MAIRVLIVDDSHSDSEILSRNLSRNLSDVRSTIVRDRDTFMHALEKPEWDIVLLDYSMGAFRGEDALKLLHAKAPSLPAIVVSGTVGEEKVAEIFRQGAKDFISKDRPARLPEAIKSVLEAKKKAEEAEQYKAQATRTQRLEILGDLSAAICHDVNGNLQVFSLGLDALRRDPTDSHVIDLMEGATKRMSEMTSQILTFARGSNGDTFKTVTAEYLVGQVGALMRRTFPPNIRTSATWEIGTMPVRCDATKLMQVLQNLCNNSKHALENGGEINVTAQNVAQTEGVHGPCVMFTVRDTGTGITPEHLPKIWAPFFSTKPVGVGTGLGLPTVKRIVEEHHGVITVESEVGKGTTFRVFIPVATPGAASGVQAAGVAEHNGGRSVLVVDDDATIRELTQLILENSGYRVIAAANGPEAMEAFRGGQRIDCLLSDLSMPIMSGIELIQALQAQGFNTPAILLSGYNSPDLPAGTVAKVLCKPVSRDDLLKAIHDAMKNSVANPAGS